MQKTLALVAAFAFSGLALSSDIDVRSLPYERISEERSEPGESLETFLLRVGPKLRAYSDETNLEACGAIATNGSEYGLVIGTSKSHLACAIFMRKVPAGMKSTGVGIHSHGGAGKRFRETPADRIFMALLGDTGGISQANSHGQDLNRFSEADRRIGAGYLATQSGVLYYDGKTRSVRMVAKKAQPLNILAP